MKLASPRRIALRFVVAFLVALFGVSCLMEAEESGLISLFGLKVNALTRAGKVEDAVENNSGHLQLNLLDNNFFSSEHAGDRIILLFGTSSAVGLPQVQFHYDGHAYRMYNFAISGNSIAPSMKLISIMTAMHPAVVLLSLTPGQNDEHPTFRGGAFEGECLGASRKYQLPGEDFVGEDSCDLDNSAARPFSLRIAFSNFRQLIAFPFGEKVARYLCRKSDQFCRRFSLRFNFFRSELASVGHDAVNEARALLGYKPQRGHGVVPAVDLGELTRPAALRARAALEAEMMALPDAPNPKPLQAADATEHWARTRPNKVLRPDGALYGFYAAIARLARHEGIDLVVYNQPLDHEIPGYFPSGYYQEFRDLLEAFAKRENVNYLDEGDILLRKGRMWGDVFHMNFRGPPFLAKALVYDLIINGYLDHPTFKMERRAPSSASLAKETVE